MRTTLVIDDEILRIARAHAQATGLSIGKVVSDLARKGLAPDAKADDDGGVPVFRVSEEAPLFGPADVARGEDEP